MLEGIHSPPPEQSPWVHVQFRLSPWPWKTCVFHEQAVHVHGRPLHGAPVQWHARQGSTHCHLPSPPPAPDQPAWRCMPHMHTHAQLVKLNTAANVPQGSHTPALLTSSLHARLGLVTALCCPLSQRLHRYVDVGSWRIHVHGGGRATSALKMPSKRFELPPSHSNVGLRHRCVGTCRHAL